MFDSSFVAFVGCVCRIIHCVCVVCVSRVCVCVVCLCFLSWHMFRICSVRVSLPCIVVMCLPCVCLFFHCICVGCVSLLCICVVCLSLPVLHIDRKNPPLPGGFPIYCVPSSRTVCKRTPLERFVSGASRGVLLHTVLDEGT